MKSGREGRGGKMGRESGIVRNLFPPAQPFPYDLPFNKKFLSAPRATMAARTAKRGT